MGHRQTFRACSAVAVIAAAVTLVHAQQLPPERPIDQSNPFKFRTGVELINVTATVADSAGRFVPGLKQEDFIVYEDDQRQTVTQFTAERVPVSLGIALDTSGSMAGDKIKEAQTALNRFLYELQDPGDEFFLYRFSNGPLLLQGWTSDRSLLTRALGRATPNGGTAMYDAVDEALPLVGQGKNQKKALLIISDGNDTTSHIGAYDLKQHIRAGETLVYAVGIDGEYDDSSYRQAPRFPPQPPRVPIPFPFPPGGGRRPPGGRPFDLKQQLALTQQSRPQFSQGGSFVGSDRVNVFALKDLTDDSGGRTEIVRDARDLNPATTSIADELSKQYYLGYPSSGKKDGKWHSIRVEVTNRAYHVRARTGYIAS